MFVGVPIVLTMIVLFECFSSVECVTVSMTLSRSGVFENINRVYSGTSERISIE